jgi:hypothetical protein
MFAPTASSGALMKKTKDSALVFPIKESSPLFYRNLDFVQ